MESTYKEHPKRFPKAIPKKVFLRLPSRTFTMESAYKEHPKRFPKAIPKKVFLRTLQELSPWKALTRNTRSVFLKSKT